MIEVVVLLAAEIDIQEIYSRLMEIRPSNAEHFERQVEAGLNQLSRLPRSGPESEFGHRRLKLSGHPYGIYYTLSGRRLMISAVLDTRQDRETIRRRLES